MADRPSRRLADPSTGRPLPPRALGGPELSEAGDPRDQLFAWLKRPDNPYFAPSFVNRVWAAYFGAGLVDPVDGFSVANPPSNARLLDALSADFIAHGFDIRRLERMILDSRAYRRSSVPAEGASDDRAYLARSSPRPLMAEVLVNVLNDALGVPGDFGRRRPAGIEGHRGGHEPGGLARSWPGSSGSSAARSGPRPATASGPSSPPCPRPSS